MENTREIEIGGKRYERVVRSKSKTKTSRTMIMLMAMAASMGELGGEKSTNQSDPKLIGGDLVREYELILEKKSNLSKRERDWVVRRFNSMYREIDEPKQGEK